MAQRYQQGSVEVIQLDDRLTTDEVSSVSGLLEAALRHRLPQVVVDLRRLRLVDSFGLQLLYDTHSQCMQRGGAVHLAAPSAMIRDVLRVTGLDQEFSIHRDVVAAAGVFAL
ncbi:MAG: STAS domain-containing protein [Pirellulaceae bacterium]|nr:STAS domain-containing protein [Pirellulaceae bacterium]